MLQFRNGFETASDTLRRRYTLISGSVAKALRASTAGFVRVGVAASIRRDDFLRENSTDPFPHNVTGTIGTVPGVQPGPLHRDPGIRRICP